MTNVPLYVLDRKELGKPLEIGTGCEWDPDRRCAAEEGSDHSRYAPAVFEVTVPGDGTWRLCNPCAWRAPFKFEARRRLPRLRS